MLSILPLQLPQFVNPLPFLESMSEPWLETLVYCTFLILLRLNPGKEFCFVPFFRFKKKFIWAFLIVTNF